VSICLQRILSAALGNRPALYGRCRQRLDALPVQLQVNRAFIDVVDLRDGNGDFPLLKDMPRLKYLEDDEYYVFQKSYLLDHTFLIFYFFSVI
jgi:hypothetical protein